MFFILSKVLSFLLSPFLWIMLGIAYAVFTKKQLRRKWMIISLFIITYFLANSFLLEEVVRKWETPITPIDQIGKAYDIGIVLGGMASFDSSVQYLQFHQSSDRLWQTLNLYKSGKIKRIFISGGSGSLLHKKETEADRIYSFLLRLGIPAQDMLMETNSRNTRENAVETAKIINQINPNASCLLVTSALHMKRALGCFQKVHLDVHPYSTDFWSGKRSFDPEKLLMPSAGNIEGWGFFIREMVGYYTYKLKGYL
jgi:uncharacterized SAM-binding protein YcdF (DUF218 family)